jgi:hypothetical protein
VPIVGMSEKFGIVSSRFKGTIDRFVASQYPADDILQLYFLRCQFHCNVVRKTADFDHHTPNLIPIFQIREVGDTMSNGIEGNLRSAGQENGLTE